VQDSKFWRAVAFVFCGGLMYVGHGLHGGGSDGMPSVVNTAHAGGVTVSSSPGVQTIYTTAPDGKTLYSWQNSGDGHPRFVGMASTEASEAALRKQHAESRQRERQREAERLLIDPASAGFKPRTQADK
jgi:hypothetical protein